MKKVMFLSLIMSVLAHSIWGQEMACRVMVNTKNMVNTTGIAVDKSIFSALEHNLSSFINDRKWTNYNYKPEEKIDCLITIEIERALGNDMYEGKLTANLSRPIFNTVYSSPLIAIQDNNISFRYTVNQPFEYDDNSYIWTVTSVAAFYVNLFLGLTYDTYSLYGGSSFYNKCQSIINAAPAGESGWSSSSKDRKNRYWLLESFTNPANENVRKFLYAYHRQGLDVLSQDLNAGLSSITDAIGQLYQLYMKNPTTVCVSMICFAKNVEYVNVYSGAAVELKQKAVPQLKRMDASNTEKYDKLLQK
jgi:hypothetical protein